MTDAAALFNLLFPFFGVIGLGILFANLVRLPEGGLVWMQVFLIQLALPCLFFRLIAGKPIAEFANWTFVAITTLSTGTAFALSYWLARRSRLPPPDRVLAGVAGSYSNVGYMGPPLVVSLLGPGASAPVALIFVFDTILLFSLVPTLMAAAGMERRSPIETALGIARRVLTHPFVVATIVGLAASLAQWQPPAAIDTMVGWLSGASAPCALFLLGVTVALRPVRPIPRDVWGLVAIKLVAHPLVVWAILLASGRIDAVWIEAAVVMAALSPALNIFVLARQYDTGIERASACVLVGTLLSIATLPAFIVLMATGVMPLVRPF